MIAPASANKVARRILLLFTASALLPVLAALTLTEMMVRTELEREHRRVLTEFVDNHGMLLFERLQQVARILESAHETPDTPPTAATRDLLPVVADISADGQVTARYGTVPSSSLELLAQLLPRSGEPGKTTIVAERVDDTKARVWLLRMTSSAGDRPAWAAGLVAPDHLWGLDEIPAAQSEMCVLGSDATPIFCPAALPSSVLAEVERARAASMSGHLAWTGKDSESRLTAYRELFLNGRFASRPWVVLLTQPESLAQAPLKAMHRVIVPLVALSLLAAGLFGLVQVRRTMHPLTKLAEAARRLGNRDFSTRVETAGTNEFSALGQAFNTMSQRLEAQFGAIDTLARIDQAILSGKSLREIGEIALAGVGERYPTSLRALILTTVDDSAVLELQAWHGATRIASDVALGARELAYSRLEPADAPIEISADDAPALGLGVLASHGARSLVVQPVHADGRACGLIAVDSGTSAGGRDEVATLLRDLAGRLAVAVTTTRRDRILKHRALFDALTGLPNRTNLIERLDQELASLGERQIAVLFIDLDGFAHVNDTLGHQAGDQMLAQVGQRLRANTRPDDIVARLGGDEFVLALLRLEDTEQARLAAQRVIDALAAPFSVAGAEVFIAGSVGVSVAPADGASAAELLRNADLAMYRAKAQGRGSLNFFEPAMHQSVMMRARLDAELRVALREGQFQLHYQPLVDARSGRIRGVEALIRWFHPERGMIPPGLFVGVAEDSGLIEPIGQWVLRTACAQFVAWRTGGIDLDDISVNVSTEQFRRPDFVQMVATVLAETGMAPSWLELEITESVLVDESGEAERTIAELAALGVRLSLDDFGTGYSSLAYLRRLPVETIKIDQSFVRDIHESEEARALVRATIDMAHALRKQVTAEGVELPSQRELLSGWGCELLQGWLFARAMPASAFEMLALRDGGWLPQISAGDVGPAAAAGASEPPVGAIHDDTSER